MVPIKYISSGRSHQGSLLPVYPHFPSVFRVLVITCNIPLVSIGITLVEGVPERNVHETHYGDECFTTQHELIISAGANAFKMKGSLVITRNDYIRTMSHK